MNNCDLALTVECPHCPAKVGEQCNPGRTYRGRPTRTWSPHMGRVQRARSRDLSRQRQTIFGDGKGNCFSTCVACLFGIPTEQVPNFCGDYSGEEWWVALLDWLRPLGWTAIHWDADDAFASRTGEIVPGLTIIADGVGPSGCLHVVLWRDGEMFHDPHPSGEGLAEVRGVTVLVPLATPAEVNGGTS